MLTDESICKRDMDRDYVLASFFQQPITIVIVVVVSSCRCRRQADNIPMVAARRMKMTKIATSMLVPKVKWSRRRLPWWCDENHPHSPTPFGRTNKIYLVVAKYLAVLLKA